MLFNLASAATVLALVSTSAVAAPHRPRDVAKPQILPKRDSRPSILPTRRSTRSTNSKRSETLTNNTVAGYVTVQDADNKWLGYLYGQTDGAGIFPANYTNDPGEALLVSFNANINSSGENVQTDDVILEVAQSVSQAQTENPYIAAVQGYYNEGSGEIGYCSWNYLYLSLSSDTIGPSSPPQEGENLFNGVYGSSLAQENAIWTFNSQAEGLSAVQTQLLSATWLNDEEVNVGLSAVSTQGYILLTGNATAFTERFGGDIVYLSIVEILNEPNVSK